MNTKEIVDKYLIENFEEIDSQRVLNKEFRWQDITNKIIGNLKLFIDPEYVRHRFSKLRKKNIKENTWKEEQMSFLEEEGRKQLFLHAKDLGITPTQNVKFVYQTGKESKEKGTKEWTFTASNIPDEQEIIEHFNIDIKKWKIVNIYHKTSFGGKYSITVQTNLLKGIEFENYTEKFDKFIEEYNKTIFVNQTQSQYNKQTEKRDIPNDVLYLVSLSDLHIGNYQKAGYLDRVRQRVFETFKSIAGSGVKKVILLNTGDMLHTNGSQGTTLGGTQLDSELPFEDAFTQGLDLITSLIDYAATLSLSVTYVNVRGNHSFDTEYCLGEALKKIYQKQNNIEILNQRETRIYYHWSNNAFMFTHGDKAVERLPLLFATEGKEFFNKAENHHILLGHTHHNSSKQFVNDRKEYAGIEVRVLGSPTSNDQWHKENGFVGNKKSIVSMLFTPDEGKYAEFNFKLFK